MVLTLTYLSINRDLFDPIILAIILAYSILRKGNATIHESSSAASS